MGRPVPSQKERRDIENEAALGGRRSPARPRGPLPGPPSGESAERAKANAAAVAIVALYAAAPSASVPAAVDADNAGMQD